MDYEPYALRTIALYEKQQRLDALLADDQEWFDTVFGQDPTEQRELDDRQESIERIARERDQHAVEPWYCLVCEDEQDHDVRQHTYGVCAECCPGNRAWCNTCDLEMS